MTWVGLEWGERAVPDEAQQPLPTMVVVDVLSFTTTLSVAMDLGVDVTPHPWDREAAATLAKDLGAMVAMGRREARQTGGISLSPASLRRSSGVQRLVMPSPNGAALAHRLGATNWLETDRPVVLAACLRNASAVAARLARHETEDVLVIPAGERWPDGTLRPAVEDLLGSGAVIDALVARTGCDLTPEASAAAAAFREACGVLGDRLLRSASGVELSAMGFTEDVEIAAELDTSTLVPVLTDGVFRAG